MKNKKISNQKPKSNIKVVKSNPQPTHQYDIFCNVKIKNQIFKIYCGDGKQKLSWLSDLTLFKYDKNFGFTTSI